LQMHPEYMQKVQDFWDKIFIKVYHMI
jgi:hypothetical protein